MSVKRWKICVSTLALAGAMGCGDDVETSTDSTVIQSLTSHSPDGRYIVGTASPAAKAAVAREGRIALELPHGAVAAYLSPQAVTALQNNPLIGDIEPDERRYLSGAGAPGVPYGIGMTNADLVPAAASPSTLCIIDSGLAAYNADGTYNPHAELAHLTEGGGGLSKTDDPGTGNALFDDNGHGTHVAGTIAGQNVGVAHGSVNLHIVKVFDAEGWAYSSSLQSAAFACRDAGATVINMSLGGSRKVRFEETAFAQLDAEGVLSIAAAGNDGNTRHSYPASYSSVMSVAAIDANKQVADFSQQTNQVEIAAPGVAVLSSTPWYSEASVSDDAGNDYAASHIEGAGTTTTSGPITGTIIDGGICDSTVAATPSDVVVCQRGSIAFSDKVNNASAAGAVVIYNNEPGPFIGTCAGACTTDTPAVSVSDADGAALLGATSATVTAAFDADGRSYEAWNGTSMATPHVAGIAGLLRAHNPSATNAEVRNALTSTAEDLGIAGRDDAYGHGLVDAAAAFVALGGTLCTDADGDGVCADVDCDDTDAAIGVDCPVCEPTADPTEICDYVDNDCNGTTDDGFDLGTCDNAGVGECFAEGTSTCTADGLGTSCDAPDAATLATSETCDGLDNDCDGTADNGFTDLGTSCSVGTGACAASGTIVCTADGTGTECDAEAGAPTTEVCGDGIDNDCDGGTDDADAEGCQDPNQCTLADVGESCMEDVDCCSGTCSRGRPSSRVCLAN